MQLTEQKPRAKQAFLLALITAAVVFLPFVIYDGGYFIYYGDFNVQQIPFYKLAHEAVRSGDIFWNWYTDLGANFIGSYSFYLLTSPFFWLTLPFPTSWLPFMMAPLLVLKTACASLTSYMYLERFVKDKSYAVLGALLYAFSGWMDFNIFFNHFHEVAVFFPLLLLGVEKLVKEDKKAFFAVSVAINAMINYWFFVGEAVFVILYVLIRMTDKTWGITAKKFMTLALEAVLGVGVAAVVLVPSVMALMGNPRTGLSELSKGWDFWLYWHEQRQPAILQSILFPPELPARPNFFPDHGAKWSSLSAWLPMLGVTGVLAYFFGRRNDWVKKILALSLVIALVPGFNSLFILLNNSYYARWFYMPVLLMALASVRALEDSELGTSYFRRGVKWVLILLIAFTLMCGVTPFEEDGELFFGLAKDLPLLWVYAGVALAGLFLTAVLVLHFRYKKYFVRATTGAVAVFSAAFLILFMASGKNNFERSQYVINTAINGRGQINLPEEPFARSDAYEAQDNLLMFWHLPNIQAFHSIVPTSIMEFYPTVGVKRDVGSRPEAEFYALRPLLSVRWLFIAEDAEEQSPMPGYEKYDTQAGFNVYENENYLPMGFAYDKCMTPRELEDIVKNHRGNMMLRTIILEEDSIRRNKDILSRYTVTGEEVFSARSMERDVAERREYTADSFQFDTRGFTATTSFDTPKLVFFSVPWESGWSAAVNGQPAQIERANIGFMAVRVPAGSATVRFDYFTPGLKTGIYISAACLLILAAYFVFAYISLKKRRLLVMEQGMQIIGKPVTMSMEEYLRLYGDKVSRTEHLQRALNEAAAKRIKPELDEDEKTFRFEPPRGTGDENRDDSQPRG